MCGSLLEFFSGDLIKLNTTIGASEQRKWLNDPEGISSGVVAFVLSSKILFSAVYKQDCSVYFFLFLA